MLCVTLCYTVNPFVPLCFPVFRYVPLRPPVLLCVNSRVFLCIPLCSPVFPSVTLWYPVFPSELDVATSFYSVSTKFSRLVANLAPICMGQVAFFLGKTYTYDNLLSFTKLTDN